MTGVDWADIRRKARASREFSTQAGHGSFTLRTPTAFEAELAAAESQGSNSSHTLARAKRLLLQRAIVGWSGVLLCDLLPGLEAEPAPWDADAAELLLDAQPAWAGLLWDALMQRMERQAQRLEDGAKN